MTERLQSEELVNLKPNQSVFDLGGEEWIVESIGENELTPFAIVHKKYNIEWGTFTINKSSASEFSLVSPSEEEIRIYVEKLEKDSNKKPGDRDYFACHCSPEGKHDCEELLQKVKDLLKSDSSNLLSNIVYSLEIDYKANITSIVADMWSKISSETHDFDPVTFEKIDPTFTTEIQCDDLEDGMAATWYAYYTKFGEKRLSD